MWGTQSWSGEQPLWKRKHNLKNSSISWKWFCLQWFNISGSSRSEKLLGTYFRYFHRRNIAKNWLSSERCDKKYAVRIARGKCKFDFSVLRLHFYYQSSTGHWYINSYGQKLEIVWNAIERVSAKCFIIFNELIQIFNL